MTCAPQTGRAVSTLVYVLVAVAVVLRMTRSWQDKRSGRQRGRAAAGAWSGRSGVPAPAISWGRRELPPPGHRQRHTAEAGREGIVLPRSPSPGNNHYANASTAGMVPASWWSGARTAGGDRVTK